MKFTNKILPFLVMAILIAIPGFAQTGNVHGKVTDTDGKPMTGVTISIDRQGITQHFEVKTDNKGQFLHAGLPTGQYQISVMKDGKTKTMSLPATVRFGGDTAVDFDLKQAAAQGVTDEQRQKAAEEKAKQDATKASFEQARAALVAKNYDEAIRLFKKAIEYNPQMAQAYYQLGISYFGQPNTIPDAIPVLEKFLSMQPTGPDAEAAKQLIEAAKAAAPTSYKSEKAIAEEKAAQEKAEKQKAAAEKAKKKN